MSFLKPAWENAHEAVRTHARSFAVRRARVLNEDNKPVSTRGYSGSVLIVNGQDRETVTLATSGENALKGEASKPVSGAGITLMIKTDGGKTGQARYKG
jgi:hypothetical protein